MNEYMTWIRLIDMRTTYEFERLRALQSLASSTALVARILR